MNCNELSGLERELVLQSLSRSLNDLYLSSESQAFSCAIPAGSYSISAPDKLVVNFSDEQLYCFAGNRIKIQFYFNKIGLFCIATASSSNGKLIFSIPSILYRVSDNYKPNTSNFYALINNQLLCAEYDRLPVFSKLSLDDLPQYIRRDAQAWIFSKSEHVASSVNKRLLLYVYQYFLDLKNNQNVECMEGRIKPLHVLYIDDTNIAFCYDKHCCSLQKSGEYQISMSFAQGVRKSLKREVKARFFVDDIFSENEHICAVCSLSVMRKEDIRFLYEKSSGQIFL